MKNCVVQFHMETSGFSQPNFVDIKVNEELLEYSKKSSKLYADKCAADYVLINSPRINHLHPTFERFDLLDEQVMWLKGWFKDTLPSAPISKLSLIRLDGDYYDSTMDGLVNLYDKLSIGGYVNSCFLSIGFKIRIFGQQRYGIVHILYM